MLDLVNNVQDDVIISQNRADCIDAKLKSLLKDFYTKTLIKVTKNPKKNEESISVYKAMLIEGFPKERIINSRTTNRDSFTYKTLPIAIYYKELVIEETQVCKIYSAKKVRSRKRKICRKKKKKKQ